MDKTLEVRRISYEEIIPAWNKLWKGRDNFSHSQMQMREGHAKCNEFKFTGVGVFEKKPNPKNSYEFTEKLVGVNAGHRSAKGEYRTRGLWVDPNYRGNGIAQQTFAFLETQAMNENCRWLWSYPRLSSLPAYMKAGYVPYGEPAMAEYEQNTRAKKDLSVLCTYTFDVDDPAFGDIKWWDVCRQFEDEGVLLGEETKQDGDFLRVTHHYCNPNRTMEARGLFEDLAIPTPIDLEQDTVIDVLAGRSNTDHLT